MYDYKSLDIDTQGYQKKVLLDFIKSPYSKEVDDFPNCIYLGNYLFIYFINGELMMIENPGLNSKENFKNIITDVDEIKSRIMKNNSLGITIDRIGRIFRNGNLVVAGYSNYID